MSFFGKIGSFLHGAAVKVSQVFVALFGQQTATQFGHDALALLNTELGKIVTAAVHAISQDGALTGAAAREAAFVQISTTAAASGIEAEKSIVNMLIEIAVNALKGHFVPA